MKFSKEESILLRSSTTLSQGTKGRSRDSSGKASGKAHRVGGMLSTPAAPEAMHISGKHG